MAPDSLNGAQLTAQFEVNMKKPAECKYRTNKHVEELTQHVSCRKLEKLEYTWIL